MITTNKNHPAFALENDFPTMHILYYETKIDFKDAFRKLRNQFGIDRMTIQTGGTLNSEFLRLGLINEISIVVAPALIGGKNTQSLIGGESLHEESELGKIKALRLIKTETLKNSYLHLIYEVLNS